MSNNAVDTPQVTQDIPTSEDNEIAPRVRKSRIGPPMQLMSGWEYSTQYDKCLLLQLVSLFTAL